MNNFCDNIKFVRELLKMSQQNVAKVLDIPQPNFARYETGITKKIPYSILNKLSTQFGIAEDWLDKGEINQNYCYEIQSTIQLNQISVDDLAKKLDVTPAFLNAIIEYQISPSRAFFERVMRAIGVEPQGDLKDTVVANVKKLTPPSGIKRMNENAAKGTTSQSDSNDYTKMLEYRITELNRKLEDFDVAYENLHGENEALKAENERLKSENESLKKTVKLTR